VTPIALPAPFAPAVLGGMVPDLTPVLPGILFLAFTGLMVVAALAAAFSKKIVHAAFGLMAAFFGVAGMYALLGSDFLALTQVIVYVGGILILIVFGVLLTGRAKSQLGLAKPVGRAGAAIAGLALFLALAIAISRSNLSSGVKLREYLFPFEFVSVFLLASLIGAAYLVRRKREGA
jgi:NADH-quinone oxidoreductase subunit J